MSLIEKVKALFNEANPNPIVSKFEDVKDQDGNLLRIEGREIGKKIEVINADGTLSPYEGETTLEDGTVISAAAGLITEIETADAEKAEEAAGDQAASVAAPVATDETGKPKKEAKMSEELASTPAATTPAPDATAPADSAPAADTNTPDEDPNTEARLEALEAAVAKLTEMCAQMGMMNEDYKKENVDLKAKNEELSKKAAAPAVSFRKFEKPEVAIDPKKMSTLDRIARLKDNK